MYQGLRKVMRVEFINNKLLTFETSALPQRQRETGNHSVGLDFAMDSSVKEVIL